MHYWDWVLWPLLDEKDDVTSFGLSLREVTEQVQAEQFRRIAVTLSAAEQRERRKVAQALHDDLQQLLVVAKLRMDLLAGRLGDEVARQSVQELRELLGESIEASRSIALDLYPPFLHDHGLTAALEWLVRWMEEKHGLKVHFVAEEGAEPQQEDIRSFLYQAVRELLLNVIQHAKVKEASVRLERAGAKMIRITVADDGVGFAFDTMEKRPPENIGLMNIRERLRYLGGSVEVSSARGKGTRVRLLVGSQAAVMPAPKPTGARGENGTGRRAAAKGGKTTGNKIRVLLADDHEVMREGLATLLREQPDVEVVAEASDGPTAVALARETKPDVIIMDVSMPGMTGVDAARQITAKNSKTRIIGLSMHDQANMAEKMLRAGAVAYLSKGGPADQLLAEVRRAARLKMV